MSSDEEILAIAQVDPDTFQTMAAIIECSSWLAQGGNWPRTKSYDVAVALSDYFQNNNVTENVPQFAEQFVGGDTDRVNYMFDFFANSLGLPFPDAVAMAVPIFQNGPHPENNSSLFIGIFVMLSVLMFAFVGLRIYSRIKIGGYVRAHDWVLLAACVITFAFGTVNSYCLAGPTHYRGRWDRTWEGVMADTWSGKVTEFLYPSGIFLVKASLLVFYWTLTSWLPLRIAVVAVGVVSFGNSLAMILTAALKCNPWVGGQGYEYFTTTCNQELWAKGEEICGSINIATDIVIWLMPLPMVWKITQGIRERFLASLTFGLGALACIACGMRFSQVQEYTTPSLIPRDQSRWLLWAMTEMFLAIICSCVPAIRALVIKLAPNMIGTTVDTDTDYGKDDKSTSEKEKTTINVDSSSA